MTGLSIACCLFIIGSKAEISSVGWFWIITPPCLGLFARPASLTTRVIIAPFSPITVNYKSISNRCTTAITPLITYYVSHQNYVWKIKIPLMFDANWLEVVVEYISLVLNVISGIIVAVEPIDSS